MNTLNNEELLWQKLQREGKARCVYVALEEACPACHALDGEQVEIGSARFFEIRPPYYLCADGDDCWCTCMYSFIFFFLRCGKPEQSAGLTS